MRAELTDEQRELREGIRSLLATELPEVPAVSWEHADEVGAEPPEVVAGVWQRMVEQGWTGLAIPEAYGGAGLGAVELGLAAYELGRCPFPNPFLSTVVVARLVHLLGTEEQQAAYLPRLAGGEIHAAIAVTTGGEPSPSTAGIQARGGEGGWTLSGEAFPVADGWEAGLLLVIAADERGLIAFIVPNTREVSCRAVTPLDLTRSVAALELREARCTASSVLHGTGAGGEVLRRTVAHGAALLAAEMAGGARALLELAVEYAQTREQFGKPIGAFQAVAHPLADVAVWVGHAESAARAAAWCLDHEPDEAPLAASIAKLTATRAYQRVAEQAIQAHGGIGFTWERGLHHHYRRARANEHHFGSADWHARSIAQLSGRWA